FAGQWLAVHGRCDLIGGQVARQDGGEKWGECGELRILRQTGYHPPAHRLDVSRAIQSVELQEDPAPGVEGRGAFARLACTEQTADVDRTGVGGERPHEMRFANARFAFDEDHATLMDTQVL